MSLSSTYYSEVEPDIVERLRGKSELLGKKDFHEAADEIEQLREALRFYASFGALPLTYKGTPIIFDGGERARVALGDSK